MVASPAAQARALFVKSAVYQRRNTATNVCLVVAPVFFCGLLAVLQVLANNLILKERDNQCGCQCTRCCAPTKVAVNWTEEEQARIAAGEALTRKYITVEQCSRLEVGYCERVRGAKCREYNDSNCRLRYSSPRQAIFCAIPDPSSWPAVIQTPRFFVRAGGSTSQWLPYTGTNLTAAAAVAANLAMAPELPNLQGLVDMIRDDAAAVLNMRPERLLELVLPMLAAGELVRESKESVDAAQLSRLGLRFGSALWPNNDYYIENAFINSNSRASRVQLLLPEGECAAAGLGNVTTDVGLPLPEMLLRYYNATYPLLVGPVLDFFNITPETITPVFEGTAVENIMVSCVDVVPRPAPNTSRLNLRLYCGFGKARCDGTYFIREYGGAWDFQALGATTLRYNVHYNLSFPVEDPPTNYRIAQLINMATQAWTKTYWSRLPVTYRVRNRLLGLMSFPKTRFELKLDFSIMLGPLFYTWVVQMLMPSLLQQLVYEKEKRLRMMMKMHGLSDVSYWLVTYLWYLMLYVVYMVFFVVFGSVIRLKMFTLNSYTMQAVLYFIFGNNMIAFMYMMSSLFTSSRTATVVGFLYVFASGLIGEALLRPLMLQQYNYIIAVQFVPGFALYRGLLEFSEYSIRAILSDTDGLRWRNLSDPGNGMVGVWITLLVEWPIFMVLGWYLEQVLNNGTGARRHPLFFLQHVRGKDLEDPSALRSPSASPPTSRPSSAWALTGWMTPSATVLASSAVSGGGGVSASDPDQQDHLTPQGAPQDPAGAGAGAGAPADAGAGAGDGAHADAAASAGAGGGATGSVVPGDVEAPRGQEPLADGHNGGHLGQDGAGSGSGAGGGGGAEGGEGAEEGRGGQSGGRGGEDGAEAGGGSGGGAGAAEPKAPGASCVLTEQAASRASGGGGSASVSGGGGGASDGGRGGGAAAVLSPIVVALASVSVSGRASPSSSSASPGCSQSRASVGSPPRGCSPRRSRSSVAPEPCGLNYVRENPSSISRTSGGSASSTTGSYSGGGTHSNSHTEGSLKATAAGGGPAAGAGAGAGRLGVPTCSGSGSGSGQLRAAEGEGAAGRAATVGLTIDAFDVRQEAERVAAFDEERLLATPIVIRGLRKVFASAGGCAGGRAGAAWRRWLPCGGGGGDGGRLGQRAAVRTLTLAIERGECFGLLGPNGAGKTTTINMLTGFLEPSAGDALVEGRSVRTGMPEIYRMMGVCPQHDLLWEQLTGEEHLLFYGRLKGLKGGALTEAVRSALKSVKLHMNDAGRRRVGTYSGGMKRRLSVAISFIGNPRVVYLDEPSTGLDPSSRRALWDVVRGNKDGRAIILTTHSMEEAEILCDRLGIFVDGQLVCIGNPREITSRYAGYLVFTLTVGPGHEEAAQALVLGVSPNSRLTYALGGTFKYELPNTDVGLSGVFDAMARAKTQMQVLDWGVANATLEEVFIKFARQIGAETSDH